jgi:hypothetical protein
MLVRIVRPIERGRTEGNDCSRRKNTVLLSGNCRGLLLCLCALGVSRVVRLCGAMQYLHKALRSCLKKECELSACCPIRSRS